MPAEQPLEPATETTASKLERLSTAIPAAVNARDFTFTSSLGQELLAHIAPNFRMHLDTYAANSQPITLEEQTERWKQRAREYPDVRFDVVGVSSSVNEYRGTANVFLSMEVTGMGHVTLHAMNELTWRKVEGKWQCVYVVGLRGSLGNAGG